MLSRIAVRKLMQISVMKKRNSTKRKKIEKDIAGTAKTILVKGESIGTPLTKVVSATPLQTEWRYSDALSTHLERQFASRDLHACCSCLLLSVLLTSGWGAIRACPHHPNHPLEHQMVPFTSELDSE
jgi:uncharacterized membrane protein